MDLYFSPLACSMGTRIAFYEAGIEACFIAVDTRAKRLAARSPARKRCSAGTPSRRGISRPAPLGIRSVALTSGSAERSMRIPQLSEITYRSGRGLDRCSHIGSQFLGAL